MTPFSFGARPGTVSSRRAMTPFSLGLRPGTVLFEALIPDDHSE
jgi:hypothetical protein